MNQTHHNRSYVFLSSELIELPNVLRSLQGTHGARTPLLTACPSLWFTDI